MDYGVFEGLLERFVDYCRAHLVFGAEDMNNYSCLPLCALGEPKVSATSIKALFKDAVKVLAPDHPGLTARWLEQIVCECSRY